MTAQIFGICAMISLFLIYQQKSRKKMIAAKLCADIFWVAHYFCLGATAGMIPNFVGIFREIIFINRRKYNWTNKIFWPVIFILINVTCGVLSFQSWYDVLPIAASCFVTFSLWLDNPLLTKWISIPVSLAFLTYDILISSYVGAVNETLAILSILLFFIKRRRAAD